MTDRELIALLHDRLRRADALLDDDQDSRRERADVLAAARERLGARSGFEDAVTVALAAARAWVDEHPWEPTLGIDGGAQLRERERVVMRVALDAAWEETRKP